MGNITSTDSRRSGGSSNNDVLSAAADCRPQKRIKLTINTTYVGASKHTPLSSGVSSNTRSTRSVISNDGTGDESTELTLPAECYALVLEYLDYQTVLSCALTSRVFLHDAMPLVKTLNIDTALQMNIPLTSRFRDVQHINLYSLLKQGRTRNNVELLSVNYDSVIRVVPFLSQFGNLQRVFFGGKKINGEIVTFSCDGLDEEEDIGRVNTLTDMISGSFASSGGLLKNMEVMGLRCPYSCKVENNENDSECEICKRACRSFPIDQVINFDNEGSSGVEEGLFISKKTSCIDVCLSRPVIESIVEGRPGGKDILRSNARLLHLLGKGERHEIPSDDGASLFIVRYTAEAKAELKRVIEYAELKTKEMSSEDLTKAIWQSFAKGEGYKVPPKSQCYLTENSFNFLFDQLDLPIDGNDFGVEASRIENLSQIAKGVMADDPVQPYCLSLLGLVLEKLGEGAGTTIQKVVDLGVIPALVELLDVKEVNAAPFIINQIALNGSDNSAQELVDAGAVPKLVKLLSSSASGIAQESVLSLGQLASRSVAIRDMILQEGALAALTWLARGLHESREFNNVVFQTLEYLLLGESPPNLDEYEINLVVWESAIKLVFLDAEIRRRIGGSSGTNDEPLRFYCTALSYICHAPSKHRKATIKAGLFPHLLNMMNVLSPEVQLPALETIRILLREDSSLTKVMIETGNFPFQCLLSPVVEVRKEACEVVLVLLNGTIEQVDILVAQGCIRALCGCGLLDLDHPVLAITALISIMTVRVCVHMCTQL